MSSFQCRHEHIIAIAALSMIENRRQLLKLDRSELAHRVETLTMANRRAVAERYREWIDSEIDPLPAVLTAMGLNLKKEGHETRAVALVEVLADHAQMAALIHCYEYQACDWSSWETSNAKGICDEAKSNLLRLLPGYSSASWGVYP